MDAKTVKSHEERQDSTESSSSEESEKSDKSWKCPSVETASSSPSLSTPSSSSEELTPSQINYDKKRPEQEEFDPFEPQVEIIEGDGEIDFADNPYFQPPEAETDPPRVLVENPLHQEAQRPQKRRRKIMRPRRNFGPNQPRRQNGRPYVKQ